MALHPRVSVNPMTTVGMPFDDAIALLLALSAPDEITLHSVTTVCGNRPLATTTRSALRILALAGRKDAARLAGARARDARHAECASRGCASRGRAPR